jgi:TusA-related sulfurtransferase
MTKSTKTPEQPTTQNGTPAPAATLELLGSGDMTGAVCAVLTPVIKEKLKVLQPGQTLLVRVDDPSARLDVPAWCMLTGNVLQSTTEDDGGVLNFLIRKVIKEANKDG